MLRDRSAPRQPENISIAFKVDQALANSIQQAANERFAGNKSQCIKIILKANLVKPLPQSTSFTTGLPIAVGKPDLYDWNTVLAQLKYQEKLILQLIKVSLFSEEKKREYLKSLLNPVKEG